MINKFASAFLSIAALSVIIGGGDTITICHATGSASNPYEEITVSVNGLNGHIGHTDDIIPAPIEGCPNGG